MNWFLIALIAPALWSITNHIDKYLIEKYFKGEGAGALIIFSSLTGVLFVPLIPVFKSGVFAISINQASLLMVGGAILVVGWLLYLYALGRDEASIVAPLFQLIPVFLFVLGYIFLNEILTIKQILGALLIILGGISLSLDLSLKNPRIKRKVLLLMTGASLFIAMHALTFKMVAIETDFWIATFWAYIGILLAALFLLIFIGSYRREFMQIVKRNKIPVIGLNVLNEVLGTVGDFVIRFAALLAPLALVQTINGFQPLFVFIFGIILTLFLPKFGTESLLKKHLAQKLITIAVMFIGTYILNS